MPLIGLSIVLLMLCIAVAIDSGRYFLIRNKVHAALDAAVLAAADVTRAEPTAEDKQKVKERGVEFFLANFPSGYLGTDIGENNITIEVDDTTGKVEGEVDFEVPYIFSGIYELVGSASSSTSGGSQGAQVGLASEVERIVTASLEISMVVDNSTSMCQQLGTGSAFGVPRVVDYSCQKYRSLVDSVTLFATNIENAINATNDPNAQAYYAYIPYSHDVIIDGDVNNFNFCIDENKGKMPTAIGLRDDPSLILSTIDNAEIALEGGTNIARGFWYGYAALRPQDSNIFKNKSAHKDPGKHPAPFSDVEKLKVSKILILLTDGANEYPNIRCDNDFQKLSGDSQGFTKDREADSRLTELCTQAKDEGIFVYTIGFDLPDSGNVKTLLRNCASPEGFYDAKDFDSLEQAFDDIANRLIDLRITR